MAKRAENYLQKLDMTAAEENGWAANAAGDAISKAFPRKRAVHAGMTGQPVPPEEMGPLLEKLHNEKRTGASAAYVHIPYCESKCLYCGFFGGKYTKKSGATYLDALLWEIENESQFRSTGKEPIHALYLGGGTPTALQVRELKKLVKTLKKYLPLANDCEITLEGRIHNFGDDKIEACLEAGVNRFSLGVQSFNTEMRQMLGRIADKKTVMERLTRLASYDQAAVVIDLIYGLPGQTVTHWTDDIKTYLDLPIDGVDLYQLNVFPGSALEKGVESGKIAAPVPLHEQGEYFLAGYDLMTNARMRRLSVSHWGRNTRERNFYNPLAKIRANCLNFGTGAGGALQGYFLYNVPQAAKYIEKCNEKAKPVAMVVAPPAGFPLMRCILSQMEVCQLHLPSLDKAIAESFSSAAGVKAEALYAPLFESWEKGKLISRDGEWIDLTLAGQFWQVNLTQALLGWNQLFAKEIA